MTREAERVMDLAIALFSQEKDEEAEGYYMQICQKCGGDGEVPSKNYFPSNPYLIDPPMEPCSHCGGSGII